MNIIKLSQKFKIMELKKLLINNYTLTMINNLQ